MADSRSLSNATSLRDGNVLRRVRQLGSARDGLGEWRLQRRTALALIPLGLYFVASMLRLPPRTNRLLRRGSRRQSPRC